MENQGSSPSDLDARLRACERITELFRLERMVYLCFAILAFMMLLACLVMILVQQGQTASVLGAFGSSGVVAVTSSRVLVMWNKAIGFVAGNGGNNG